jgi:hypothetical protein
LGFRQGGAAGFGLRRVLVNERGEIKGELKRGEHKSLQTDRVILMPGPDEEVAWVNKMYRWLIKEDLSFREIADRLNEEGVTTDLDRPWNSGTVRTVLTNEKYIGNNVYNRSSFKLTKLHVGTKRRRIRGKRAARVLPDCAGDHHGVVGTPVRRRAAGPSEAALCGRGPAFWRADRSDARHALVLGISKQVRVVGAGL